MRATDSAACIIPYYIEGSMYVREYVNSTYVCIYIIFAPGHRFKLILNGTGRRCGIRCEHNNIIL